MKARTPVVVLRLALVALLALLPVSGAFAQGQGPAAKAPGIEAPITATALTGEVINATFSIQRFVQEGDSILAVGKLTGTITNAAGNVTNFVTQVRVPVLLGSTTATCEILHLELGPLDLNLLGLVVHLDKVVLDITAVPGAGNLLGNLLCAIAGLLDGGLSGVLSQLTGLLNQLLGILG